MIRSRLGSLLGLATLVACGAPRVPATGHDPPPPPPAAASAEIEDDDAVHVDPIADEARAKLGQDLEAAYAERVATKAGSTERMLELRARAEKLAGQAATIGVAGDFIAALPSPGRLRLVTGDAGATVLDASNVPIGWFDISRSTVRCPPCDANAKTLVAVPLATRLVAVLPQHYANEAIIVDVATMRTVANVKANLSSIALAPNRARLALVDLEYDDGDPVQCRGALVVARADGTIQRSATVVAPNEFCHADTHGSWRTRGIVIASDWSDEILTVDPATGSASAAKRSKAHRDDANRHASHVLCGRDRERVKAAACSVGARWVFPPDACAGATPGVDDHETRVCARGFSGL